MDNKNRRVIRIDADGNKKEYKSVTDAAKDTGVYPNQIARGYRENKTVKGYHFEYPAEIKVRMSGENHGKDREILLKARKSYDRPPFYMNGKMTEGKIAYNGSNPVTDEKVEKLLENLLEQNSADTT